MRLFILKSIVFSMIVLSIYAGAIAFYTAKLDVANDYMAIMIDKHERLSKAGSHRLLLVGGSNLPFGIDSEKMQDRLGLPVVNLGVHAGLGGEFVLNEAKSVVQPGDTVVVCLEYSLYSGYHDIDLIEHAQLLFPAARAYYQLSSADRLAQGYKHFKKAFNAKSGGFSDAYNRHIFNTYGDVVVYLKTENNTSSNDGSRMERVGLDETIVRAFRDIAAKCKTVGARLYLAYPPYPSTLYAQDKAAIQDLDRQIKTTLDFIPRISCPDDCVMDDSYFYNSRYHLNETGKEKRTESLIKSLFTASNRVASR